MCGPLTAVKMGWIDLDTISSQARLSVSFASASESVMNSYG